MDSLPQRESTNFPLAVLKALEETPKNDKFLLYHQILPVEYFTKYPRARGILMMHETGTGKSINSIAIADAFRKQGRRVLVIVAKTLQNNFRDNIVKYKINNNGDDEKKARTDIESEYKFVSANANNMMAQLRKVSQPTGIQDAIDSETGVERLKEDKMSSESISLEGTLVIVDEAHNLFNGVVSGSKNARGLYDTIMRTRDIRVVFLTSNVIINTPFELVPCFNMIAGYDLLPTVYTEFVDTFIDEKTGNAKNLEHLKARIFGLISYYGSWYQTAGTLNIHMKVDRKGLPTRLPIKEVFVPMSVQQYGSYLLARDKESQQKSFMKSNMPSLSKPKSDAGSTYRIKSRQYSNFWLKEDEKVSEEMFERLDTHSPKFKAILDNIHKHDKQHGMIFSSFVRGFGLTWFAMVLEFDGYIRYNPHEFEPVNGSKAKRYAYITGDMKIEERSSVLNAFNSKENKDGSVIQLLLGSPAMSEGVDTKRIRHVHLMESLWHFSAIDQIIARAVRFGGHDDLPVDQRDVQPYIYLSDYPTGAKKKEEPTTDVMLYYKSLKKKIINDKFFKTLIEASIDCGIHMKSGSKAAQQNIKCMLCVPDNKRLFNPDIASHIRSPLTCRQSEAKNIKVSEVKLAGKKFYYSKAKNGALRIYEFDAPTSSYIRLPPSSKWYSPLFEKLTLS
jgi:hypothetical protein